jgi:hypothetical protein
MLLTNERANERKKGRASERTNQQPTSTIEHIPTWEADISSAIQKNAAL